MRPSERLRGFTVSHGGVEQVFRPAVKLNKPLRLPVAEVHRARIRHTLKDGPCAPKSGVSLMLLRWKASASLGPGAAGAELLSPS
jgi:hypothetical protein